MSDSPLPEYVDARKAFSPDSSIEGSIELTRLPRVAACLTESSGVVQADLAFSLDESGRRRITGELNAALPLICQRCLEANVVALVESIDLVLVNDETEAQALEKSLEPWIVDEHRIVLADLVEEQLLLGMPIVNYHDTGPCSERNRYSTGQADDTEDESSAAGSNSPFAVLANLKQD